VQFEQPPVVAVHGGEQMSTVILTLEPFAMANGQSTQSYKVKRDAVTGEVL
jgi:hypothetical protein